jgi:hypothetical protein
VGTKGRAVSNSFDLGTYNDVASRIADFREKHPDGSLQPLDPTQPYRIETIGGQTFIVYVAACYRTPDDIRPGIGTAQESYPGRTPYTKGSEVQNAETSAWGRAIVAALAADTRKGIASSEDVRNRQAEQEDWEAATPAGRPTPSPRAVALFEAIAAAPTAVELKDAYGAIDPAAKAGEITQQEAGQLVAHVRSRKAEIEKPAEATAAVPNIAMTPARRKALMAALKKADVEDREERLAYLADIIGHPIESSNDLTLEEFAQVMDRLKSYIKSITPPVDVTDPHGLFAAAEART